jgi:tetratricopeptide (TPR) repeat protein
MVSAQGTQTKAQAALPDLPEIILANFGPAIREQVKKADDEARRNPLQAEAIGRLGMTLQTYEQHELAAACYERARRLAPMEPKWVYYLGVCQTALGRHGEAILSFRETLQRSPELMAAQIRLAEALLAAGELNESQQLYETAISKYPEVAQAHYGLGRVKAAKKEPVAAISHLRRAIELFPAYGAAHYGLALAWRDAGDQAKAKEHLQLYQQHKNSRPAFPDPLLHAVDELNVGATERIRQGIALEAAGRIEESIAEHERALEINPQLIQAHINLIQLYGRSGQTEKAEQHYRAAVALNPNIAESHYNFGVMLVGERRLAEARQAFERALEISPNYAEAHFNVGALLLQSGKLDAAMRHFQAAVDNRPDHRMAHFELGRLLVHKGELAEAISHFQQTLKPEDENTPRYLYALAATYVRAGDRAKGLPYLRAARDKAAERGQKELLASIERDLKTLEQNR